MEDSSRQIDRGPGGEDGGHDSFHRLKNTLFLLHQRRWETGEKWPRVQGRGPYVQGSMDQTPYVFTWNWSYDIDWGCTRVYIKSTVEELLFSHYKCLRDHPLLFWPYDTRILDVSSRVCQDQVDLVCGVGTLALGRHPDGRDDSGLWYPSRSLWGRTVVIRGSGSGCLYIEDPFGASV